MVFSGAKQSPGLNLRAGELVDFNFAKGQFDLVFLSGALNEVVDNTGDYARSIVIEMFNISKYGVAFNLLNKNDEWISKRVDLQSFSPEIMVSFCKKICEKVELVDNYLENDFTIYLTKN